MNSVDTTHKIHMMYTELTMWSQESRNYQHCIENWSCGQKIQITYPYCKQNEQCSTFTLFENNTDSNNDLSRSTPADPHSFTLQSDKFESFYTLASLHTKLYHHVHFAPTAGKDIIMLNTWETCHKPVKRYLKTYYFYAYNVRQIFNHCIQ